MATPSGEALHAKLAALPGVKKLDPTHLLNCAAEPCDFRIFRIVRVGRALRAVRLLRAGRGARVAKVGVNQARAVKKSTRVARRSRWGARIPRLVEQPGRFAVDGGHVSGTRKRCLECEPQAVPLIPDPDLPGALALVHDHVVVFLWLSRHAGGRCNSGADQNSAEWWRVAVSGWQFLRDLPTERLGENAHSGTSLPIVGRLVLLRHDVAFQQKMRHHHFEDI